MRIIPTYPKKIIKNPFNSGILIGSVVSLGYTMVFFVDIFYGVALMSIGITYYYYKYKEFNGDD